MTQKFIDRDGLKVLWNQVNLKDYPNNETLMAVIDAIDETKADANHTHTIENIEGLEDAVGAAADAKFYVVTFDMGSDNKYHGDLTFAEIREKFEAGGNMVARIDGTDYIPLLSTATHKIIFSGIYENRNVALTVDSNNVCTLTTTVMANSTHEHSTATQTSSGFMSKADKIKLDGINPSNYETKEDAQIKYDTIVEAKADKDHDHEGVYEEVGSIELAKAEIKEDINNIGGTIEVTSGEPTKENTVVTISPSSEITNIYTAEEVDAKFEQMSEEKADQTQLYNAVNEAFTQTKREIEGIKSTLEESEVSGAISYQFTTVGDSSADVDVELSTNELLELNTTVETLRSLKKANTSVIAFLTDLHIESWTADKIKKAVVGYNKISASVKTDLLLFGGDYLENNAETTKEHALSLYSDLKGIISYCNNKPTIAVIKGNHDDNTMHTDYVNGLVDKETFWSVFGNMEDDRTVRNAGNVEDCYGYYDIPNQKIRVFYLNTVDLPQKLNETTNTINYKGQWDTGFSIKQLQFVADHLKFDSEGWQVMVFSHHPIMRSIAIENNCGVQADRGGSALLELLDKFNTGNAKGSISVTGTGFSGTVEYDFSDNKDCKLIACVNGHTHRDSVDIHNSFFCISTRAVYGHPSYDGHISSSAYFVVDRNNNKLHLIYNGDGEENVFDYVSLTEGEDTPTEPDEPTIVEIESPFTWQIGQISNTTGHLEGDSQEMRISTQEIIAFTKDVTIDMSSYDGLYVPYWYDVNGNFLLYGSGWTDTSIPLEVPANSGVRFKLRNDNYEVWTDTTISRLSNAVKIIGLNGVESYVIEEHSDEAITFRIGAGVSDGDAWANNARMMATQSNGVKPYANAKSLWGADAYPITVPSNATKIKITCPNFIYGLMFSNIENNAYVTKKDSGWQTLGGGEYSFTAGAYKYVHINFKNSSNSAIPIDTDTSGFSVDFE